jgi:hypothetical protein
MFFEEVMLEEAKKQQRQKDKAEEDFLRSLGINEENAHECTIYRRIGDDRIIAVRLRDKFLLGEKTRC